MLPTEGIGLLTLRDSIRVVREHWVLVVAGLVLGVIVAVVVTVLTPRQYSSSVVLYVAARSGADTTQANYQGSLLSEQRVKSYQQMITSDRILAPAAAQIPGAVLDTSSVTASVQADTTLITATVTDRDPVRAAQMANAVATVFSRTVDGLERAADPASPAAVSAEIFEPAVPSSSPVSPKPLVDSLLGLVLGLLAGLGAALARHLLDTRVRSLEDISRLSNAPNLGAIGFDKQAVDRPLVVETDPTDPRAEAFRQIRTNLQFVDVENDHKVVVVTSSLPEEGKSASVCNLALALRAAGLSCVVIEGDLRRPKVTEYFGLDRTVGLTTVLTGQVTLDDALQPWRGDDLQVLASGILPPNPSELLGSRNMQELLEQLSRRFAVVLIDAPPLLPVTDAAAVGRLCDGAIVLVRHGETTKSQLSTAIGSLEAASVRLLGTVLNFVPTSGPNSYAQYGYYRYEQDAKDKGPATPENGWGPADSSVPRVESAKRPNGAHSVVLSPRPYPVGKRDDDARVGAGAPSSAEPVPAGDGQARATNGTAP